MYSVLSGAVLYCMSTCIIDLRVLILVSYLVLGRVRSPAGDGGTRSPARDGDDTPESALHNGDATPGGGAAGSGCRQHVVQVAVADWRSPRAALECTAVPPWAPSTYVDSSPPANQQFDSACAACKSFDIRDSRAPPGRRSGITRTRLIRGKCAKTEGRVQP